MKNQKVNARLSLYVTHSTAYDFKTNLYIPLRASRINSIHKLILPHEKSDKPYNSKELIAQSDLVLAEVSYSSTGQGIELGWAHLFNVPIVCILKANKPYSNSLSLLTNIFISYQNGIDLVNKLDRYLSEFIEANY
jgi:hypothetical protein